jgi:tetratricopeptide (TPR) repeat protein
MKISVILASVAVILGLAGYASVTRVPEGQIGVVGEGDQATVLEPGLRLHRPFSGGPALYPLSLGPVKGRAPLRAADGQLYEVSFEISGHLDEGQILDFHAAAAERGAWTVLSLGASHGIADVAATRAPADLASGAILEPALGHTRALLDQVGVRDVSLSIRVSSPLTLMRLARALAPDGLSGLVRGAAEEAVAAGSTSWEAHTALGIVLELERDITGAEERYLDALSINPAALPPMAQLVKIYSAVEKYEKLDRLIGAALQADPSSVQHHNWLGGVYLGRGMLDRAEETFQRALGLAPADTVILNNLGGVYLKQERRTEAIESFRRALSGAPGDRQSLYNLGVTLCSQGECEEGLKHLLAADQAAPAQEQILRAIAQAYRAVGNEGNAREWEGRAKEAAGAPRSP